MQEKRKQIRISDKHKGLEILPFRADDFTQIKESEYSKNIYGKELVAKIIKKNLGKEVTKEPCFKRMVNAIYDGLLLKAKEDKEVAQWVTHYLNPPFEDKIIH